MKSLLGFLLMAGLFIGSVRADVVSASAHGFEVRHSVALKAAPETVWRVLVHPQRWWLDEHTWSGKAKNLSLDLRAGGCFCEKLKQGSVRHMQVVYVEKNNTLRLQGGLGPMQEQAIDGVMTWELLLGKDGTQLTLTYRVHGYLPDGLDKWSGAVDQVLGQQLQSLRKQLAP